MNASDSDRSVRYRIWLHVLAIVLMLGTFGLVSVGGNVTSEDAGMAVPDWPGTFGYNMFLAPLEVWMRDPATGQWFHGRFWEHLHRLLGSTVGLITIAVAVGAWFTQRRRDWVRWLGMALLGAVIVQGLMGGFRVTENSVFLAAVHGVFGQLVLAVTVLVAAAVGRVWIKRVQLPTQGGGGAEHAAVEPLWRWEIGFFGACVVLVVALIFARTSHGDAEGLILLSQLEAIGVIAAMTAYMVVALVRLTPAVKRAGVAFGGWHGPQVATMVLWAALVVQLILGASVRHAGADKAIPDAPLAYGSLVPPMTQSGLDEAIAAIPPDKPAAPPDTALWQVWLQYGHRAWAFVVTAMVLWALLTLLGDKRQDLGLVFPSLMLTVAVTALQVTLGIWTVWSQTLPPLATLHQATGAALLGLVTWLAIRSHLAEHPVAGAPASGENRYNPPTVARSAQPA